jgi:protein TonB
MTRSPRRLPITLGFALAAHEAVFALLVGPPREPHPLPGAQPAPFIDLEPEAEADPEPYAVSVATTVPSRPAGAPVGLARAAGRPSPRPAPPGEPPPPAAGASSVVAAATAETSVPVGPAPTFAGGTTAPDATSDLATYNPSAAVDGLLGGTGTGGGGGWPRARSDRSAPARLGGRVRWTCPWPHTADELGVNHATAHAIVEADADGRPLSARIVDDPGFGFGPEAQRCAMSWRYVPAQDRDGRAVRGSTQPFAVQFDRVTVALSPR